VSFASWADMLYGTGLLGDRPHSSQSPLQRAVHGSSNTCHCSAVALHDVLIAGVNRNSAVARNSILGATSSTRKSRAFGPWQLWRSFDLVAWPGERTGCAFEADRALSHVRDCRAEFGPAMQRTFCFGVAGVLLRTTNGVGESGDRRRCSWRGENKKLTLRRAARIVSSANGSQTDQGSVIT
jgi:hypothetical protein